LAQDAKGISVCQSLFLDYIFVLIILPINFGLAHRIPICTAHQLFGGAVPFARIDFKHINLIK
jgi:hypothetical protein